MHTLRQEFVKTGSRTLNVVRFGPELGPRLFLLHGWMDCAASFRFMAESMPDWHIIAPDLRGFGASEWNSEGYYSTDYLADLDALLEHYAPDAPVNLAGHSMGAMIAGLYAGIRPERVARLAMLEGFGLADTQAEEAPGRLARWLREKRQQSRFQDPGNLDAVAARLVERAPALTPERARWLAEALTVTRPDGRLDYRADPRHKMVNPVLYRLEETMACWRNIRCPVLWVIGGESWRHPYVKGIVDSMDARRACFRDLREVTLEGTGHMLQWEQPEALARIVSAHFSEARA